MDDSVPTGESTPSDNAGERWFIAGKTIGLGGVVISLMLAVMLLRFDKERIMTLLLSGLVLGYIGSVAFFCMMMAARGNIAKAFICWLGIVCLAAAVYVTSCFCDGTQVPAGVTVVVIGEDGQFRGTHQAGEPYPWFSSSRYEVPDEFADELEGKLKGPGINPPIRMRLAISLHAKDPVVIATAARQHRHRIPIDGPRARHGLFTTQSDANGDAIGYLVEMVTTAALASMNQADLADHDLVLTTLRNVFSGYGWHVNSATLVLIK